MNFNLPKPLSFKEQKKLIDQQLYGFLVSSPELDISLKQENVYLDKLWLEIELRDGKSKISDVILTEPRIYEAIFHKEWFYRLADMLGVSRSVMNKYVKPKFVKDFFINYVYSRFSFNVLRELRSARKLAKVYDAKLFQFLKDDYYFLIEKIALEIYNEMEGKNFEEFVNVYSKKHKLPVQQILL